MNEKVTVVKIGGNVIDSPENLKSFLEDFAKLPGKKALVHGGGKEATRLSRTLGIETKMVDGRRITDEATISVVTMVYAGLINKRIVSLLQSLGCDAIGLTGADGNVIKATRRSPEPIDFGFVGDINPNSINLPLIVDFWKNGLTPVFCAICHDGRGELLNCNADTIASALATAISKKYYVTLTYCFEKPGVLRDVNDETSVIPEIRMKDFDRLIEEGLIAEGMIPKLKNSLDAVKSGVSRVRICNFSSINQPEKGTVIL